MNDIDVESNLPRAIIIYILIALAAIGYAVIDRAIVGIVSISLVLLIFLQFILSKKIFEIRTNGGQITFSYLLIIPKTITYDIASLVGKLHKDVQFRGGKDLVLEIFSRQTNKKIFEINKRLCKSEDDFQAVLSIFGLSAE